MSNTDQTVAVAQQAVLWQRDAFYKRELERLLEFLSKQKPKCDETCQSMFAQMSIDLGNAHARVAQLEEQQLATMSLSTDEETKRRQQQLEAKLSVATLAYQQTLASLEDAHCKIFDLVTELEETRDRLAKMELHFDHFVTLQSTTAAQHRCELLRRETAVKGAEQRNEALQTLVTNEQGLTRLRSFATALCNCDTVTGAKETATRHLTTA